MYEIYTKLKRANYIPSWFPVWESKEQRAHYIHSTYQILHDLQAFRLNGPGKDQFASTDALLPCNVSLNRYRDILPFNHNRIQLENSYINASTMESIHGFKKYIVAQGPLPNTVSDFWNMIWQEQCGLIVMLTTETEKGRIKCHKYWPDNEVLQVGSFQVKCIKESTQNNRIHREFQISNETHAMIVDMIHFIAWPDHKGSDPQSVLQIVDFANQIYKEKGLTCPMVIHCSAGVGRTGTFCTIDSVLCHLKQTHIPPISRDLFEPLEWEHLNNDLILLTVNRFRHQRIWAVQSEEQFSLCYDAILIRLNEWHDSNINKTW